MTNFERIKQMNIKELSELLRFISYDWEFDTYTIDGDTVPATMADIEEWLESEVAEND